MKSKFEDTDYLIEFKTIGNVIKVTAIDPVTLKEVSIVGSPKVPEKELARAVVRKLVYVLSKN